jgi:hypothetical protein
VKYRWENRSSVKVLRDGDGYVRGVYWPEQGSCYCGVAPIGTVLGPEDILTNNKREMERRIMRLVNRPEERL